MELHIRDVSKTYPNGVQALKDVRGPLEKTRVGEHEEQMLLALSGWNKIHAVPVASELARVTGGDVSPATACMVTRRARAPRLLLSRLPGVEATPRVPSVGAEAGVRVR